jgi:hypothetical protein
MSATLQAKTTINTVPSTLSSNEVELLLAWMLDETALQTQLLAVLEKQKEALRVQNLPALDAA